MCSYFVAVDVIGNSKVLIEFELMFNWKMLKKKNHVPSLNHQSKADVWTVE